MSNPTRIEQHLLQKDFNFGAYLREIRLRNPFSEEIKRIYWQLFTLNVGILILLVQQIDNLQKKCGFEYLGFCGRDTHYLRLLYEKYKLERGETPTPNDYLHYSRKLVRNSGDDLAKYFSAKINNRKALMIDLYGTGTHFNNIRQKFNVDFSILICIRDIRFKKSEKPYFDMSTPEKWIPFIESSDISTDKNNNFYFYHDKGNFYDSLENLNRSTHNSPVQLKTIKIGEKIFPKVIFSEANDKESFDVIESCLNEVLNSNIISSAYIMSGESKFEEILVPLLDFTKYSSVVIPLQNRHQLNEQVDRWGLKFLNNISV